MEAMSARTARWVAPMGSGLRNMADRLAALGGRLEVRSAPTHGTTITGHLPTVPSPAAMIGSSLWQSRIASGPGRPLEETKSA